ncbi:hypothetical protein C8N43_1650 [Litoreibacter ponti]|uniref:Bromoperoxidase n=1 Tax=Litoreibacter ponti TaxID=1510457 RepID=A0A2T6BLQ9_9RHOB|nr:vanadium-dependent haloperoxidase [Litoreibacter ponti]PTX56985.1 hypothetical protein C8N43_1650 [Litoreibacter ponti]
MPKDRQSNAHRVRIEAADLAHSRPHPTHAANGDETRFSSACYALTFTKGLCHDVATGLVSDPTHFEAFRGAIDEGYIEAFTSRVPVPQDPKRGRRRWEAPTAGSAYDLQGPDAQAVTMPPAPAMGSSELDFELAEVYELALLRDTPLLSFDQNGGPGSGDVNDAVSRLNAMDYAKDGFPGRPRTNEGGQLTRQTVFRGSGVGVEHGPYLSQFLWIGSCDQAGSIDVGDGYISYGGQRIDQRVLRAKDGDDHMTNWQDWLDVQKGFDVNGCGSGQTLDGERCFIHRPRDLATYVHFDALYQAYLNATLILLGMGTPFDPGFAKLSGMRDMFNPLSGAAGIKQNAGGFALYGGPQILTLVTEVATRALKAVRYQKFNNHLRLRPEALAGRLARACEIDSAHPSTCGAFSSMRDRMVPTLSAIDSANPADPALPGGNLLLPMAFREGSPMHPTYGAGHATVAGACVTIVKAFFDTGTVMGANADEGCRKGKIGFYRRIEDPCYFEAVEKGKTLDKRRAECPLTLEGELNKLAANVSIGRNMAGVHYYSDYYDSLRMGEEIAIGMLQEQALCYPTDDFVLSVPTFDGDLVRIGGK